MPIPYEDDQWLVVNKPCGVATHGAWDGDCGIVEWLDLHLNKKCFVVSRLDKDTSGVLLLARSAAASGLAEHIHRSGLSRKVYCFVTDRTPQVAVPHWRVETPLDGREAATEFSLRERWPNGLYLVEARLSSGKRHQVRRHAAQCGIPLLGDTEYGGTPFARVCLHAQSLEWPGIGVIETPLPPSFMALSRVLSATHKSSLSVLAAVAQDRRLLNPPLADITNAMRLVHRGECGLDIAIDQFADAACVWDYTPGGIGPEHARDILGSAFMSRPVVVKRPRHNPNRSGGLCDTSAISGQEGGESQWPTEISEHNLKFAIDLGGSDQTGFFIDQRDNRRRVARLARDGARVANLFSYTCSFSVVAAASGCSQIVSVDNSRSALGQGLANLRRNGLERPGLAQFVHDDVRSWLARQQRKGQTFDLVICDPPTFGGASAKTKSRAFRIDKEWSSLARTVADILRPGGQALFCCNSKAIPSDRLNGELAEHFVHVTRHRTPLDFPEQVDERHNRFFWCKK